MSSIVFVSPVEVDRPVDGLRWRAHLTARGLAQVGTVTTLEVTTDRHRSGPSVVHAPRTMLRRMASRVHPRQPARVAARSWRAARKRIGGLRDVDLVWVMQPDLVAAGAPWPHAPMVVDMVDLEHGKYDEHHPTARHQRARWRAAQQRVARRADAMAGSHAGEVASLGHPRAVWLPNAVDVTPVVRHPEPATLVLVGRFTYQPNLEAAQWFVDRVLPRLRMQSPSVRVRLVGRHDGRLEDLRDREGVDVVGFVEDLDREWSRATAMVAPVLTGTGTRLKIIEAFARGVPVVSTTLGCDGLEVEDGRHLLIADDADEFAAACQRLMDDAGVGEALARDAAKVAARDHDPRRFETIVSELAADLLARAPR